jgi:endonuclease/exonuclease/phosphatase family metal-dependent hydrolase
MRFATLNVWGTRGDWSARRPVLRDGFRQLDADVVTLQETIVTADSDQSAEILGSAYHRAQQSDREDDGQGITTASRWPFGRVLEVDLRVTDRTGDFRCGCLITEILAPQPWGRLWVANHLPDYQLEHERERRLQALVVARRLEELIIDSPGHVIVAGDLDADSNADSVRFWTGRHVIEDTSVCYRSCWESTHPQQPLATFTPQNPNATDWDWPFRGIDHILVRCGDHGGPTLPIRDCRLVFDTPSTTVSDHFGLVADLDPPPPVSRGPAAR